MEKYFDHGTYRFGTAKLVSKHGKYPIPITYEVEWCPDAGICNVVGVDGGIYFLVAI